MNIVRVHWVDSTQARSQWMWAKDIDSKFIPMISVGVLVVDEPDYVVVGPHFSLPDDDGDWMVCGDIAIPRCAITSIANIDQA